MVLLPVWHRPAFLLATLKLLLRATYSEDHLYLFQIDHGKIARLPFCHPFCHPSIAAQSAATAVLIAKEPYKEPYKEQ